MWNICSSMTIMSVFNFVVDGFYGVWVMWLMGFNDFMFMGYLVCGFFVDGVERLSRSKGSLGRRVIRISLMDKLVDL